MSRKTKNQKRSKTSSAAKTVIKLNAATVGTTPAPAPVTATPTAISYRTQRPAYTQAVKTGHVRAASPNDDLPNYIRLARRRPTHYQDLDMGPRWP